MTTEPLTAPFPYYGGKRWVAEAVWERFGDVPNYCEPFFGSGAVLLARPTVPGTETVNDADALLANFWRAVQSDPEAVATHADWPVSECDLHARHLWLVNEGRRRVARLQTDPEYFDAQAAGWWLWGICQWIGSGWCSGKGPHRLPEDDGGELAGDARQLPHLGNAGTGIHKKLPHLGDAGRGDERPCPHSAGVSRQLPHLGDGGRGEHRAPGVKQQSPRLSGCQGIFNGRASQPGTGCEAHTANLIALMQSLSDRLRRVRICCGDWTRILGPSVTEKHGLTGIFLDPPYSHAERERELYTVESDVAAQVREWAVEHGENPLLRIALCGYDGEHDLPPTWERYAWKARGGYGSQGDGRGRENAAREVIWFSPACLRPARVRQMALTLEGDPHA